MTANLRKLLKTQLVILCGAAMSLSAHANQIGNGGFETPVTGPGGLNSGYTALGAGSTIGPWSVVGPSGSFNHVALVPSTEYSTAGGPSIYFLSQEGSQSLDLTGEWDNGAAMGVQQSFSTTPGQTYSLSFYVGAVTTTDWSPHQGNAIVNVLLNGNAFQTAINSDLSGDATTWKQFNYNFTATGSTTTLAFMNGVGPGVGHNGLDNVAVSPVPEPGTASLLLLGAAGLLRLKRK
jgi:hypothetical protein